MSQLEKCPVDGCEKPRHRGAVHCSMHRARLQRYGSTDPRRGSHGTMAERYERFVVRAENGCWSWSGCTNGRGYTKIGDTFGHRVSWEIHFGSIPTGRWVLHRCDNPTCTNPDHLFLGTHADNMADAAKKGRLLGSPSRGQKITREQAAEIRLLRSQGWTRRQVSERFGIHVDNVTEITSGRMWRTA